MVDLSVVGLLVALRYLSLRGIPPEQITAATRLMHVSGLLTLALNIAEPIAAEHYGRAAVDAVAPLLLLGWGAVGPQLLRCFHAVDHEITAPATKASAEPVPTAMPPAPAPEPSQPEPSPLPAPAAPALKVPEPLLTEARSIAASHRAEHGEPITAAQLKMRLAIGLPMATALHAAL